MSSNINNLRQADSELWCVGSTKRIQTQCQPQVSNRPVPNVQTLKYRGNYYYSSNPSKPFVRLIPQRNTNQSMEELPLVTICNKQSYLRFLTDLANGEYNDLGISIDRIDTSHRMKNMLVSKL